MTESERKTTAILIKLTDAEKQQIEGAARLENLPTGTWMRTLALKEARKIQRRGQNL